MRKNKKIRVIIAIAAALTACGGAVCLFLKKRNRVFFSLTAAVILCGVMGAATTAYAAELPGTEPEEVTTETEYDYDTEPDEIITGEETEIDIDGFLDPDREPNQFTPPGNLTLVDDYSGAQSDEKQFITVTTKNGNTFYIIIDRAGKTENVYFLNLVDEYDLLQILPGEDAEMPALPPGMETPTPTDEQPGQDTEPDTTPKPKNTNTTGLLIMLVVIAAIGGGAFYYFKVLKPKQGGGKKPPTAPGLDEFEFDPDEDDLFSDGGDGAEYDGGDNDGENPDFTDADEPIPDFSFENTDFGAETPESEGDE